ncbi:MAG: carbohydrate-binding domain-containing protein [Blautia sp.]|nr:carbohydrate-binding domain-containing protein [Blautia sp.]
MDWKIGDFLILDLCLRRSVQVWKGVVSGMGMNLYGSKRRTARFCSVVMAGCLAAVSLAGCGDDGMEGVSESLAGVDGSGLTAGSSASGQSGAGDGQAAYTSAGGIIVASEMFTDRDLSGAYDAAEAKEVVLSGEDVTITKEGVYLLSGTMADGTVIVDADKNDKVQLVLDGVDIDNDAGAAIYVKEADKVFVTLAEGSENILTSRGYASLDGNNIDGVIYAKSDLVINGTGSLTVNAEQGHGIVSKDDLKITGGVVTVTAEKQGLSGKDSVRIGGGTIQITSGKDGVHAENDEDAEKGYVYISDGTIQVASGGDGISAGSVIQMDGGTVDVTAGGGSANRTVVVDESGDAVSAKGIKAAAELAVNQVVLSIDSQDDAIHSDLNVIINGGELSLATGDDGIHANETATVTGGTIYISESYEGIEGNNVEISGGTIRLYARDDGLNAAGGNDQSGFGGMFGGGERFGNMESGGWEPGNRGNGGWGFGNDGSGGWNPGSAGGENLRPDDIGTGGNFGNGENDGWNPGDAEGENQGSDDGGNGGWNPGNAGNENWRPGDIGNGGNFGNGENGGWNPGEAGGENQRPDDIGNGGNLGNGENGGWNPGDAAGENRRPDGIGNGGENFGNGGNGGWNPADVGSGGWNPGIAGGDDQRPDGIGNMEPGNGGGNTGNTANGNDSVDLDSDISHIWISGGVIYVRADGDGVDSNGNLLVSGGEVYISGPENGANGAIDYERNGQITGGIVVAAGNSGMAMNFGNASTQGSIMVTIANHASGTAVTLRDSEGKELISYTPECAYNSLVVSSPEMVLGGTYIIAAGEESTEVTLSDSLIYGFGFGMGGFGNGRMPGGRPPMSQ